MSEKKEIEIIGDELIEEVSDEVFDHNLGGWGVKELDEPKKDQEVEIGESVYFENISIKRINVKFHGLMPEHELEAIKMYLSGTPLGEIADHFGMARSDIVYTNKAK